MLYCRPGQRQSGCRGRWCRVGSALLSLPCVSLGFSASKATSTETEEEDTEEAIIKIHSSLACKEVSAKSNTCAQSNSTGQSTACFIMWDEYAKGAKATECHTDREHCVAH